MAAERDLISFDDVPTGILIEFSPLKIPEGAAKPADGGEVKTDSTPSVEEKPKRGGPSGEEVDKDVFPTELACKPNEALEVERSGEKDQKVPVIEDEDAFFNETPPDFLTTPPDSPAVNEVTESPKEEFAGGSNPSPVPRADFDRIAEETRNIVCWMKEESEFSIGDQITYKPENFGSAARSSRPSIAPQLEDVLKRYRRISSAITSTPGGDDADVRVFGQSLDSSTPVTAAGGIASSMKARSSLRKEGKVSGHSDASKTRQSATAAQRFKKAVSFEDPRAVDARVQTSGGVRRAAPPRMLKLVNHQAHGGVAPAGGLAYPGGANKENVRPVARVGPMRAVKPVACMVKPLAGNQQVAISDCVKKPVSTVRHVPKPVLRSAGGLAPSNVRRSGSVDRLSAGLKSMAVSSLTPSFEAPAGGDVGRKSVSSSNGIRPRAASLQRASTADPSVRPQASRIRKK